MSIILEGVSKSFGERRVLQNVNLTLPDRGAVCFFGPSGCGKTTLTLSLIHIFPAAGDALTAPAAVL